MNVNCQEYEIPIGIQTFKEIRQNGYVYVDKTENIYKLDTTGKYYFLSRPRRFGKSLLLSTVEEYFSGRQDLFKGLAMERLERDRTEHPVVILTDEYDKALFETIGNPRSWGREEIRC